MSIPCCHLDPVVTPIPYVASDIIIHYKSIFHPALTCQFCDFHAKNIKIFQSLAK